MPEMKKSGIAWVNDIPTSWKVHPIYAYFKERKATNASGKERNLLSLSYGRIVRKDIDSADGLRPASYITYNIVMPGDIVIRPTDLQNDKRSLRTGLVTQRGIITSAYIALAPTEKVYSPFFHYLLHSYDVMKVFYNMGSGVRQSLSFNDFAKLKVLVPPLAEQRRIADYLDERCGAIDEAKKSIEEEVDALRRLRVATIFRAVTKGLDDGVPMRDSGVQWVGAIPESWETPRFKNVYRLVKRTGYPEEELLSVYLNYGVIRFSDDDGVRVHKTSSDTSGYQLVLPGELVMNNQQAWRGSVGVSSLRGIISPAYHVY